METYKDKIRCLKNQLLCPNINIECYEMIDDLQKKIKDNLNQYN